MATKAARAGRVPPELTVFSKTQAMHRTRGLLMVEVPQGDGATSVCKLSGPERWAPGAAEQCMATDRSFDAQYVVVELATQQQQQQQPPLWTTIRRAVIVTSDGAVVQDVAVVETAAATAWHPRQHVIAALSTDGTTITFVTLPAKSTDPKVVRTVTLPSPAESIYAGAALIVTAGSTITALAWNSATAEPLWSHDLSTALAGAAIVDVFQDTASSDAGGDVITRDILVVSSAGHVACIAARVTADPVVRMTAAKATAVPLPMRTIGSQSLLTGAKGECWLLAFGRVFRGMTFPADGSLCGIVDDKLMVLRNGSVERTQVPPSFMNVAEWMALGSDQAPPLCVTEHCATCVGTATTAQRDGSSKPDYEYFKELLTATLVWTACSGTDLANITAWLIGKELQLATRSEGDNEPLAEIAFAVINSLFRAKRLDVCDDAQVQTSGVDAIEALCDAMGLPREGRDASSAFVEYRLKQLQRNLRQAERNMPSSANRLALLASTAAIDPSASWKKPATATKARAATDEELAKMRATVDSMLKNLDAKLIDRQVVARIGLLSVLCKEHTFLIGPPGTAKSLSVRSVLKLIQDSGNYFEVVLHSGSTLDDVIGPYDLGALDDNVAMRTRNNKLAGDTTLFAFLDECFKAQKDLLTVLLSAMNERIFYDGTKQVDIPLHTLFGASNEVPKAADMGALLDRFLFRVFVPSITRPELMWRQDFGQNVPAASSLSMLEVRQLIERAGSTPISEAAIVAHLRTIEAFLAALELPSERKSTADYVMGGGLWTDRRRQQLRRVLRIVALSCGRREVHPFDLLLLVYGSWKTPDQMPLVQGFVLHMLRDAFPPAAMTQADRAVLQQHLWLSDQEKAWLDQSDDVLWSPPPRPILALGVTQRLELLRLQADNASADLAKSSATTLAREQARAAAIAAAAAAAASARATARGVPSAVTSATTIAVSCVASRNSLAAFLIDNVNTAEWRAGAVQGLAAMAMEAPQLLAPSTEASTLVATLLHTVVTTDAPVAKLRWAISVVAERLLSQLSVSDASRDVVAQTLQRLVDDRQMTTCTGCFERQSQTTIAAHMAVCPKRPVPPTPCLACGVAVASSTTTPHDCPAKAVTCPHCSHDTTSLAYHDHVKACSAVVGEEVVIRLTADGSKCIDASGSEVSFDEANPNHRFIMVPTVAAPLQRGSTAVMVELVPVTDRGHRLLAAESSKPLRVEPVCVSLQSAQSVTGRTWGAYTLGSPLDLIYSGLTSTRLAFHTLYEDCLDVEAATGPSITPYPANLTVAQDFVFSAPRFDSAGRSWHRLVAKCLKARLYTAANGRLTSTPNATAGSEFHVRRDGNHKRRFAVMEAAANAVPLAAAVVFQSDGNRGNRPASLAVSHFLVDDCVNSKTAITLPN